MAILYSRAFSDSSCKEIESAVALWDLVSMAEMEKVDRNPSSLLAELARLMDLNEENPFRVRAFRAAAKAIEEVSDWEARVTSGTITQIKGIGSGIEQILKEYLKTGTVELLVELAQALPEGLLELTEIPGLGAKKARVLIEELGIQTPGELEYACRENRLVDLKGFGKKLQTKLLEATQYYIAHQGYLLLPEALEHAATLKSYLDKKIKGQVLETGALRRRVEILDCLEFLLEVPKVELPKIQKALSAFQKKNKLDFEVKLYCSPSNRLGYEWAKTTASRDYWEALGSPEPKDCKSEESFYEKIHVAWAEPELRETKEAAQIEKDQSHQLLGWKDIQGFFHAHTLWSDGSASVEKMVVEAKKLGYRYIGISDHSRSAVYANGLNADRIKAQEKEVRQIQEKYPDIRVFWGIESDILADGSLDYDQKTLSCFDFVIASIHNRMKMDRDQMTARILKAIQNPSTRFIGHLTGRLLLGRKGYDLDFERIFKEAAKCQVAIELNCNPQRLDVDWRWGSLMNECQTLTSVNPDAHDPAGIQDVWFGTLMARKGLISKELVMNARSEKEVEKWLLRK